MHSPKKRMRVIDDDVDSCETKSFSLGYIDYEVTMTQDPDEAIAGAACGQFDLYLIDNSLPG